MGRIGSSYDNTLAESFFATLKRELLYGSSWLTREQARAAIVAWMAWYNGKQRHSSLGYRSPSTTSGSTPGAPLPWNWSHSRLLFAK